MNSQQSTTDFAWKKLDLPQTGSRSTAVCKDSNHNIYSCTWNNEQNNGHLMEYVNGSWNVLGTLNGMVTSMCSDSQNNIYVVGENKDSNGKYAVYCYNGNSKSFGPMTGSEQSYSIDFISCGAGDNLYITGKFEESAGLMGVMQYIPEDKTWSMLTGSKIPTAAIGLCVDSPGNLYVLAVDSQNTPAIYCWNLIDHWTGPYTDPSLNSGALALCCDDNDHAYIAVENAIITFNLNGFSFQSEAVNLGKDPMAAFIKSVDSVLFVATYSIEKETTIANTVLMSDPSASGWKLITPPGINDNYTSISDITAFEGKSNNLVIACSQQCVYEGDQLIH